MATTYTLINKTTLGSSATSITFSSIPNTYTDLLVKVSARSDISEIYGNALLRFNGSSSNYSIRALQGSGASAVSYSTTQIEFMQVGNSATSNTFGNAEIYIPNYAGSNYKSVSLDSVGENNSTTAYARLTAGLWSDTSAITSIAITPLDTTNWLSGSSFYLYGIKNS
jgi:hypothetical protein